MLQRRTLFYSNLANNEFIQIALQLNNDNNKCSHARMRPRNCVTWLTRRHGKLDFSTSMQVFIEFHSANNITTAEDAMSTFHSCK